MNSLTFGATTLVLPEDLRWVDEFDWPKVEQARSYTFSGSLVLESRVRQAGRPITLAGESNSAWIPRSDVQILQAQEALPSQVFRLVIRGEAARAVIFNRVDGDPIRAEQILDYSDPAADDPYQITLRCIEV